jgi:5'-3' exoribonuclease 1
MVGNDFLPHIPSIEIIEHGIELMIEVYKETCTSYGHLTTVNKDGSVRFRPFTMSVFLGTIGQHEKENFEIKLSSKDSYFPDLLLQKCSKQEQEKWNVDIKLYKKLYIETLFPENTDEEELCHSYLEGMQWVLSYYTRGVPNWRWFFPYHYAPPASVLAKYVDTFEFPKYDKTVPNTPFQQLLCVLPPKSSNLIPEPLRKLLCKENTSSQLLKYCPDVLNIDLSGKRKEWEGIVLLPIVDFDVVQQCYSENINFVDPKDSKRDIVGKSFIYKYSTDFPVEFRSYYGDITNCCVARKIIDI